MREDAETLFEMMLCADRFCSEVESAAQDLAPTREHEELRLKILQCRTLLRQIRNIFDEEKLTIENASVRGDFRQLVMALMWVAFHARRIIDFKVFRKLVMIESSFSYLLISR